MRDDLGRAHAFITERAKQRELGYDVEHDSTHGFDHLQNVIDAYQGKYAHSEKYWVAMGAFALAALEVLDTEDSNPSPTWPCTCGDPQSPGMHFSKKSGKPCQDSS